MKLISCACAGKPLPGLYARLPDTRPHPMDIQQLRTFVTVARVGSITRAAEALHITQPAASGQIKSLEEELSLRLLTRTTASLALTQAGQELLPKAEHTLEAFAEF